MGKKVNDFVNQILKGSNVEKIIIYALGWFKKTQFCGNQLLFHFLNLYLEKKTLARAVACTIIYNTASTMTNLSLNSQNS